MAGSGKGSGKEPEHGGRKTAALVRRLMEATGADVFGAAGAVRRHGKDEEAAREELLRANRRAVTNREGSAS